MILILLNPFINLLVLLKLVSASFGASVGDMIFGLSSLKSAVFDCSSLIKPSSLTSSPNIFLKLINSLTSILEYVFHW
jgi:hypothetical protein